MKTEFNVERVCERVQLCVVDAPDELGEARIEVKCGSLYVSFPHRLVSVFDNAGDGVTVTQITQEEFERGKTPQMAAKCDAMAQLPDHGGAEQAGVSAAHEEAAIPAKEAKPKRKGR